MYHKKIHFDAILIISEILAILSTFYLSYLMFVLIVDWLFEVPYSHQQILNFRVFTFSTTIGRITIFGELFGGFVSSFLFMYFEGKFRKSCDFMTPVFVLHFIIITCLCGFPKSFCWWFSTIFSAAFSIVFAGKVTKYYEFYNINPAVIFSTILHNAK